MNKVALVLTRTLGDVLLIHNLVDGIYKKYGSEISGIEIDVYVNELYKDLLEGNPKITRIKTSPDWMNQWNNVLRILFIEETYDNILIAQQLSREDNLWHHLEYQRKQHLVDFYLDRCRLPKRTIEDKLQIFLNDHDRGAVDRILCVNNIEKFVVMHTTTLVASKNWDHFQALAAKLADQDIAIMQVGQVTDVTIANDVKQKVKVYDLRDRLTLRQIGALCEKAKCFVGLDSGISYVAAATGIPVIILQGATIPETSGPWGYNVIHLVSPTHPKCEQVRCHGNCLYPNEVGLKCINYITVDRVFESVKGCLEESV